MSAERLAEQLREARDRMRADLSAPRPAPAPRVMLAERRLAAVLALLRARVASGDVRAVVLREAIEITTREDTTHAAD